MYSQFIDTVRQVVVNNGAGILIDSRLWNILRDSYSLNSDIGLKKSLRKAIDNGYIAEIANYSGSRKKVCSKIQKVLDIANSNSPGFDSEFTAILFSVAIAKGLCLKSDYSDFISRSNPNPLPVPAPTPTPPRQPNSAPNSNPNPATSNHRNPNPNKPQPNNKPSRKRKLSREEYFEIIKLVVFACIASFGVVVSYATYFRDWWPFFVILVTGLVQFIYLGYLADKLVENTGFGPPYSSVHYKKVVYCISVPFVVGICCNSLYSLVYYFTSDASILTFFLCCIYILIIVGSSFFVFSDIRNPKAWIGWLVKQPLFIKSTILVIIGYSAILSFPYVVESIEKYEIYLKNRVIEQKYHDQISKNRQLQNSRNKNVELSFKDIKLGVPFAKDVQIMESSGDMHDQCGYNYNLSVDDLTAPIDFNECIDSWYIEKRNLILGGQCFKAKSTVDNIPITITVYDNNGIASMLMITPYLESLSFEPEELASLKRLYSKKYGEPEYMSISGKPSEPRKLEYYEFRYSDEYQYDPKNDDCVWSFANGSIRITDKSIIYLTNQFGKQIKDIIQNTIKRKRRQEKERADSIQSMKDLRIKQKREKDRRDSVVRMNNHNKAIHEI